MTHDLSTRERAIDAYAAGDRLDDITRRVRVNRRSIYRWLGRYGIALRSHAPDYDRGACIRRVEPSEVASLYAQGLNDCAIACRLHLSTKHIALIRHRLGLPVNHKHGWPGPTVVAMLVMMAGGAQAKGWQGHTHEQPDPFANMLTAAGGSCCSSRDCSYTEECVAPVSMAAGVIGPDGRCHEVTEFALQTRNCAIGATSACFVGSVAGLRMLCVCRGGVAYHPDHPPISPKWEM